MIEYTKDQKLAIELREKDILISAAAGSGKTRVLVDRVLSLMCNERIPIEKMLIVTFTNKAAMEMRLRIESALRERLINGEDDPFIIEQAKKIKSAPIQTMHAFCIDQLHRYFYKCGIHHNFGIIASSLYNILISESMDQVFDEYYEDSDEGFLKFVESFGSKRNDENAKATLIHVYHKIQAQIDPFLWIQKQIETLDRSIEQPHASTLYLKLIDDILVEIEQLILLTEESIALTKADGALESYASTLEEDISSLREVQNEMKKSFDTGMGFLNGMKFSAFKAVRNLEGESLQTKESISKNRSLVKSTIKALVEKAKNVNETALKKEFIETRIFVLIIERLLVRFNDIFQSKKREQNRLDFSDVEHQMLKLLTLPEVKSEIKRNLQYIFFDEYQDSNQIQEKIVNELAHPRSLFFVGDIKQSIYGFRLADPSLFNARFHKYMEPSVDHEMINLCKNFRSDPEILHFCNYIFGQLMKNDLGDVEYERDQHELVPGKETKNAYPIEIRWIEKNTEPKAEPEEAVWICKRIKELIQEGYQYSDIAILMRSPASKIRDFELVFKQYDIPLFQDFSSQTFNELEVLLFIDLLKILDNESNDLSLIAVMNSFFGGFREKEIGEIRAAYPDISFIDAARDYAHSQDNELSKKLNHFFDQMREYRQYLQTHSLTELCTWLMIDTGYEFYLESLPKGEKKKANVEALIGKIREYEKNSTLKLVGFLKVMNRILKNTSDRLEPVSEFSEEEDVVRMMSIHKSKGLEFKVVFLANTQKNFNRMDTREPIIVHKDLGFGLYHYDIDNNLYQMTTTRNVIIDQTLKEMKSEEARLLYVALTRAEERLIITGDVKSAPKVSERSNTSTLLLRHSNNYMSWLMNILPINDPYRQVLDFGHFTLDYEFIPFQLEEAVTDLQPRLQKNIVDLLNQQITDPALQFKADNLEESLSTVPIRTTVTELTKKDAEDRMCLQKPTFLEQEEERFTATEKGSITHLVFQNISLDHHNHQSITQALDEMVADEFFTKDERDTMDADIFLRFFQSPLGQDVLAHKLSAVREQSFAMEYEQMIVYGQIDLFYRIEEGYVLVDFKTDQRVDELRYEEQIKLYRRALEQATGIPVVKSFIYWASKGVTTECREEKDEKK